MSRKTTIAFKLWTAAAVAVALPLLSSAAGYALSLAPGAQLALALAAGAVSAGLIAWAVYVATRSIRIATTTLHDFARGDFEVVLPRVGNEQACEVLLALRQVQGGVRHVNTELNRISQAHDAGDI
ncbi:methyl-accepting chemotaxis protein, partial [Xanthomonas sp. Kuri4-2]